MFVQSHGMWAMRKVKYTTTPERRLISGDAATLHEGITVAEQDGRLETRYHDGGEIPAVTAPFAKQEGRRIEFTHDLDSNPDPTIPKRMHFTYRLRVGFQSKWIRSVMTGLYTY